MSTDLKAKLFDLKARQDAGEHMPCPRCGRDTMKELIHTNALSRHADIYICDACGTEEALLKFMHNPLPMHEWACFRPTQQLSDFTTLSAEAIWERVQDTQVPFLMSLYERWQEEHEYEDFSEYRAAAFESCPGLTELWPEPFQAKYDAADGAVLVRFKTDLGGTLHMAIDTVEK